MPSDRRREKELAGDSRAGWSARTSVRERHRVLIRAQWRPLAGLGLAVLALFGVSAVLVDGPLQRGVILGSGLTLTACMIAALVVLLSGTAPLMMGEMAEQWTAQELRPLSAHGWRLVNHFGLGRGDQDHVMVGPGGIVLVETKWGGTPWDVDAEDRFFRSALKQTARNARQLALWHGVAKHGRPEVQPVLAVWGPAARTLRELPARRHSSGVVVMSGNRLQEWMRHRPIDRLARAHVDGVFDEIDRHLVRRDRQERSSRPMPRSLGEMVQSIVTGLGLGLASFLLTSWLLRLSGSLLVWSVTGLVMVAAAEVARRRTRWRWELRSFEVGFVGLHLLTAVAVARAYM